MGQVTNYIIIKIKKRGRGQKAIEFFFIYKIFTLRLRLQKEFDSVVFFLAKVESKVIIFLNFANIEIFRGITKYFSPLFTKS